MKPICIIPARGSSKRFPRKNVALLKGKPLLSYVIDAAKKSGIFDLVVVSSEDAEILKVAKESGADRALVRPPELAEDSARVPHVCTQVIKDFAEQGSEYDHFGVILPTSPLVEADDVLEAYKIFNENDANYVGSYVPYEEPPQYAQCVRDGYVKDYFPKEDMKRSQEMESLYYMDGSILFAKTDVFLQEGDFFMSKTMPYFIPVERSSDIDEPMDLKWAEFKMESLKCAQ